jgi:protocatechuate 3,4-dioxygenase beta subunit
VVLPQRLTGDVLDADGRPVAGATVLLRAREPGPSRRPPPEDAPPLASVASDARGEFSFDLPSVRSLEVSASAPGHARAAVDVVGPGVHVVLRLSPACTLVVHVADAAGRPVRATVRATGTSGASATGIADAAGVVRFDDLPPGAASVDASAAGLADGQSGPHALAPATVAEAWLTLGPAALLAGRVVDAGGGPVPGAEVHVARPGRSVAAGVTSAEGEFGPVAAGAPGERVLVAVRADGYAPALEAVVLGGAETSSVEVSLRRAHPWTGRVVDAAGRGVQGALVTTTSDGIQGREAPAGTTDADGAFTLPPPPPPAPGRQVVLVASRGSERAALGLAPGAPPPEPLVLTLTAGHEVRGRVVRASGEGVAGAQVRLLPVWSLAPERRRPDANTSLLLAANARGLEDLVTATAPDGRWSVPAAPDGAYDVRVEVEGHPRFLRSRVEVSGAPADAGTAVVGAGARVQGRVLSREGAALAGARVRLLLAAARARALSTTAGPDGAYLFEDVPPGASSVGAEHPGFEGPEAALTVEEGSRTVADLVLDRSGSVVLQVTRQGAPWTGTAVVHLRPAAAGPRPSPRTLPIAAGVGRWEGAPAGEVSVELEAPGGEVARTALPVEVSHGRESVAHLALLPAGALRGSVATAAGTPVPGASLHLASEGLAPRTATADAAGRFEVQGLSEGAWELVVSGRGGVPWRGEVHVAGGRTTTHDVSLEAGGHVQVRVEDEDGRAVEGAIVLVAGAAGGSAPPATRTSREGRARLEHLPSGTVRVLARAPDGRAGRTSVVVTVGETADAIVVVARP